MMTKKVTLAVCSFLVSVILAEGILNLIHYQKKEIPWGLAIEESFNSYHPNRIYSINPNRHDSEYNSSDSLSFRFNPSHKDKEKIQTKNLIIAVGDSFTYSAGVKNEESYPFLLEQRLRDQRYDVIVHNAGVPGYGPDQEFIYIKDDLLKNYSPDILIWNIHVVDLGDSNDSCLFRERNDNFQQLPAWRNIIGFQGLILKHLPRFTKNSALVNLLLRSPSSFLKRENYTVGCTLSLDFPDQQLNSPVLKKIKFFFKELNTIAEEKKVKIVIVLVPYQSFFDEYYDNNDEEIKAYQALQNTFKSSKFILIDSNEIIAGLIKPNLMAYRKGNSKVLIADKNNNILGESSENLAQTLFFYEPQFGYGQRHLNKRGNELFAGIIAKGIRFLLKR